MGKPAATDAIDESRFGALTASAHTALIQALAEARIRASQIVHIRTAHYAVFRVDTPTGPVLARVGAAPQEADLAFELDLTGVLADQGAPVGPPASPQQVLRSGDHAVGLWAYLDNDPAGRLTSPDVGALLAAVHRAGTQIVADGHPLPPYKNPAKVRGRLDVLDRARTFGPTTLRLLGDALDERAAAVHALAPDVAPEGLLHGDFQPGNLLRTPTGLVAIDWETACRGPLHWDLTALEGRCRRGQYPDLSFPAIVDGYLGAGGPALDDETFAVLCRLRDLATTVAACAEYGSKPSPRTAARAARMLSEVLGIDRP